MAHTLDTSLYSTGTGNPQTMSYTCGNGTTVFVLGIATANVVRSPGGGIASFPTFGGKTMFRVDGSIQRAATSPEALCEFWYLLSPSTGAAYTVSASNTGATTLYMRGASFKAGIGKSSAYDSSIGANGTTANPSSNITVSLPGSLIVQSFATGLNTIPAAGNQYPGEYILRVDHGLYGSALQWYNTPAAGTYRMGYTAATSDDWGMITAAFKETYTSNQIKSIYGIPDGSVKSANTLNYSSVLAVQGIGN